MQGQGLGCKAYISPDLLEGKWGFVLIEYNTSIEPSRAGRERCRKNTLVVLKPARALQFKLSSHASSSLTKPDQRNSAPTSYNITTSRRNHDVERNNYPHPEPAYIAYRTWCITSRIQKAIAQQKKEKKAKEPFEKISPTPTHRRRDFSFRPQHISSDPAYRNH